MDLQTNLPIYQSDSSKIYIKSLTAFLMTSKKANEKEVNLRYTQLYEEKIRMLTQDIYEVYLNHENIISKILINKVNYILS